MDGGGIESDPFILLYSRSRWIILNPGRIARNWSKPVRELLLSYRNDKDSMLALNIHLDIRPWIKLFDGFSKKFCFGFQESRGTWLNCKNPVIEGENMER